MQIKGQGVINQINETFLKHPVTKICCTNVLEAPQNRNWHSSLLNIHGRISFQNTNEQICQPLRVHNILKNQQKAILIPLLFISYGNINMRFQATEVLKTVHAFGVEL